MFPSYRNQSVDLQSKSTTVFYMMGTLVAKGLTLVPTLQTHEITDHKLHKTKLFHLYYLRYMTG